MTRIIIWLIWMIFSWLVYCFLFCDYVCCMYVSRFRVLHLSRGPHFWGPTNPRNKGFNDNRDEVKLNFSESRDGGWEGVWEWCRYGCEKGKLEDTMEDDNTLASGVDFLAPPSRSNQSLENNIMVMANNIMVMVREESLHCWW